MLEKQRESAARLLATALAHRRTQAMLASLHVLPPLEAEGARTRSRRWSAEMLEEGDVTDFEHDSPARLHRLRRQARRVRFAREWLGLETGALRDLQDELGQLHDLDELRKRLVEEDSALDDLDERMHDARQKAKAAWRSVREEILDDV
jgi:CHAD domain-containing protein